ncbi:MAG: KamA family radical SAM protein [Anaerolineae bacterium]
MSSRSEKPLEWSSWHSQLQHRITTLEQLREWIDVTPAEEEAVRASEGRSRWSITPYYASLMDREDPWCPVRRQAVPWPEEFVKYPYATVDPVGDTVHRKTNRVVHKYPDRLILLVTEQCPVYCRHCTRKYHTADVAGSYFAEGEGTSWEPDFEYIASHPEVRDVLLTGGDPLIYSNDRLDTILTRLRAIPHVEIVRIGSRTPVVLPQRITPELCEMLESHHPIWFNTHFNHAKEITEEAAAACDRLTRHGIVVQNQSVLLKGINDDLETMHRLLSRLLEIRVRPYYLYHCDNAIGISHFVTTLEEGRALMRQLKGFFTGFGVPEYVLTTPLGKIPLCEEYLHRDNKGYWIDNYEGKTMRLDEFLPFGGMKTEG